MNNSLTLIGRITKDMELRTTDSGKAVVDINLAINNGKDDTTFIKVSAFEKTAENVYKYCKKGSLIGVNCTIKNHNWTDKEGNKKYDYNFIVNRLMFLDSKKEENTEEEPKEKIKEEIKEADPFEEFAKEHTNELEEDYSLPF